jgi:hypothetical protein
MQCLLLLSSRPWAYALSGSVRGHVSEFREAHSEWLRQPTKPRAHAIPRYALRLLLDDIHPAKSKSFCKRGTYASSAVQNRIEFGAINVIALREGGLISLAFNCRLEQINDVVITKHRQIARFARRAQSDVVGTSLIIGHVCIERVSR